MIRFVKNWFFSAFLLFFILTEGIFHAFLAFSGASAESGQMQYMFIGIFAVAMLILFKDIKLKSKGYKQSRLLVVLALIVFLYIFSSLFVPSVPDNYITYLLVFGSKSIPACIIGMHLARVAEDTLRKVDQLIPFFIIPVGVVVGLVGFRAAMMSEIVRTGEDDSGGLNYQILSYYMAEYYAYSAYYLFFSTARNTRLFVVSKWIMFVAMFFFAVNCIMGGGRGAMVFMVLVTTYIFYQMIASKRIKKTQAVFIIIGLLTCFVVIASRLGVFESTGFERVAEHITSDDSRSDLHKQALSSFWSSPLLGHGIGSVWWEVGFYSHNMIFDVLVEGGIIGCIILLNIAFKIYKRMIVLCRYDSCYIFLMLMLLKASLNGMFSGYYLGLQHLWLIVGLIFVRPSLYYKKIRLIKHRVNNKISRPVKPFIRHTIKM